jgi:hypothetical protein
MSYAIDVSHHQRSAAVPWEHIAQTAHYCICRASYGAQLRDREVVDHVRNARRAGFVVGLYVFWRNIHSNADQLALFRAVADSVGYGEGDVVPAVDIEHDPLPKPGRNVSPTWSGPAREFTEQLVELYGDCMVYITQREFGMLGKPAWVLDRPLWVAHYTRAAKPATPANVPAVMWQHRVGPYDPQGPGGYFDERGKLQLDQNRVLRELPRIGAEAPKPIANTTTEPAPATMHYLPMEPNWQAIRADRDAAATGNDPGDDVA